MLKKIVSYVWIYTILFNSVYSIFLVDQSFAENDLKLTQPSNKTYNSSNYKNYSTDTLIVKFKNTKSRLSTSSITNSLSSFWKSNIEMLDNINVWLVHFDNNLKDLNKVVSTLKNMNNVEYVEPDYVRSLSYTGVATTDTYSNQQWYLDSIHASEAWNMYNDTENKTIVSVNDSWFDYTNSDLSGNLKDLSSNCNDDTGNQIPWGCVNHWWNFEWSGAYNTWTAVFAENEIYDLNWHGTHVAWTIWAVWNNGTWVIWVTQNASIMWARVYSYHNNLAIFYVSNTIRALNFAIQNWAKVVNASYGWTSYSQAEYDAINVARTNWVLVVAAAWNSSTDNDGVSPFYPASYDLDNIISVASVWWNDNLASYSNYWATSVDIAAPGWDIWLQDAWILSTFPYYQTVWSHNMNSFSWITQTGAWMDWNIYNSVAIESQSWAFNWLSTYTWSEDKTLIFNETFDLSGAKFAKFSWYFECELQSGDNLEVLVNDQVIWTAYPYWTYDRAVAYNYANVEIPIPANLYNAWSQIKVRFSTNSDWLQNYWCTMDDFSIQKYETNKDTYASLQWTSMATPVVTWVAAMLWSYKPELTYSQVKDIILTSKDTIPSLSTKVATSWKINAQKAIKELMYRYWITKNWVFGWDATNTNYINLNGKNISISDSFLNINWTWTVISLSWSSITWTWDIFLWKWTSVYNEWIEFFSTSSNFDLILKDWNWNTISWSWNTYSWSSLILDYTWAIVWSGVKISLSSTNYILYDWPLSHNVSIPLTQDFTGTIYDNVYQKWELSNWISPSINIMLSWDIYIATNTTFNYVWAQTITWALSFASGAYTNNRSTSVNINSSVYPVNYVLTWDIIWTLTWTLTNSWSRQIQLTWSTWSTWERNISMVLSNNTQSSDTITWSIILDENNPHIYFYSHTNNQVVNQASITLTWYVEDWSSTCDQVEQLLWLCTNSWISSLVINWSWVSLSWSTFSKNIDIEYWENIITYQVTDNAWNIWTWTLHILRTEQIVWSVEFSSGSVTNNTSTILSLTSSEYPINYQITWDLIWTNTGVLNSTWTVNITLTSWDGVKNVNLILTKSWFTQNSSINDSILLDTVNPNISFTSHINNQVVNQSIISLTWTLMDWNGNCDEVSQLLWLCSDSWIANLIINWTWVTLSWSTFSKNISLVPWNNTITYQATDLAGNASTGSINIVYQIYNVDNNSWNTNNTWSLLFLGNNTSSTWAIFNSTGSITVNSSTWSHRVVLSLSWLTISSSSWDGIFNPPEQITFSWTFSNWSYTHIPSLTFDIWSHNTELNLTWTTAQVNLFVGTSQNGKTLSIFRSTNNWVSYSLLTTCLVSSGICSFNTDKFSLFTLATSGSSGSSSSSSSTSGGWSSSGWASLWGTVSTAAACTDAQLECRTITTGSWKTNKWYKKDWVTCEWWNLWKVCNIDTTSQITTQSTNNTKKLKPVKDLLEWYEFKSKVLDTMFKKRNVNLLKIDDDLSNIAYLSTKMDNYREDYRTLYTKLVESAKKLDDLLAKKDSKAYQEEYKNFLSINDSLNNFKTEKNISFVQVWLDKVYYLKYENTKINKIQSDLFKKINKKQANTYMYRLANKVAHNLNELLTNKALTKDEIQTIRTETINTYKEFIIQYNKLAKK